MPDFSTLQNEIDLVKSKIDALSSSTLTAEQLLYVSQTLATLANTLGVDDIVAATASAVADVQAAGVDTIAVVEGTANGSVVTALLQAYTDLDATVSNVVPRVTSLETSSSAQESAIATAAALAASASFNPWKIVTTNTLLVTRDRVMVVPAAGLTLTLPAGPNIGDTIEIVDIAGTAGTTNFTVVRNNQKIQGLSEDLVFNANNAKIRLIFSNSTYGWRIV